MAYHHLAKSGSHRYCSSKNMFLVCQVIKQGHTIKGELTTTIESLKVTQPTLMVIGTVVVEI